MSGYQPRPIPDDHSGDFKQFKNYMSDEFRRISDAIKQVNGIMLPELHVEPHKPRDGMIVFADGSDWDPGSGAGMYSRVGSLWVPLFPVSGTYTPTLFNTTNVAASTAYLCSYARINNFVIVTGRVDIDPTAGSAASLLGMSIPIPSNFTSTNQAGGTANCASIPSLSAGIYSDATNDRVGFQWTHTTDTANRDWFFTFGYTVL